MDRYPMNEQSSDPRGRRSFLRQVVSATAVLPLAPVLAGGAATSALVSNTATTVPTACKPEPAAGYLSLGRDEAAFVETLVDIMCPADDMTPSGVDCGLPIYIDRQLAGDFGRGAKRYSRGPWQQGKPEHGYQLPMTPEQHFKAGVAAANEACVARYGGPLDQVPVADAGAFLADLGAGKVSDERLPMTAWFNELVYPLFVQACFADPIYGGNRDKTFWRLIGYPGLPATNTLNVVQYRGKPFPGSLDPKSIADFS
jgi:gluconate 2-dehydrogenase gamma chain